MFQISRERYHYEVQTFVWDFLLLVVALGLSITTIFTMMSDQFLGVSGLEKMNVLMPMLKGSTIAFGLQLVLMVGVHGLTTEDNYRVKSNVVLTIAVAQFFCVLHNYVYFLRLMPSGSWPDLKQIECFYWLLSVALGIWLVTRFWVYLYRVRISRIISAA